jgi:hypothetical protein
MAGKEVPQLQHSKKFMKKVHAAEVRQTLVITGDLNVFGRIFHSYEFLTGG